MRRRPELIVRRSRRMRRIVEQAQPRRRPREMRREPVLVQIERQRHGARQTFGQGALRRIVFKDVLAEPRQIGGPLVRPLQGPAPFGIVGCHFVHHHQRFRQIGPGDFGHARRDDRRRRHRHVAAMGLVDLQRHLRVERQRVEPPAGGESARDRGFGYAVPGDVKEAEILVRRTDGLADGAPLGDVVRRQIRHIDDGNRPRHTNRSPARSVPGRRAARNAKLPCSEPARDIAKTSATAVRTGTDSRCPSKN